MFLSFIWIDCSIFENKKKEKGMSLSVDIQWNKLLYKISEDFNVDADKNGVLLLIGIQEMGLGFEKEYSREKKMDLINLAECTVLTQLGYYEKTGYDNNGWPAFRQLKIIPRFSQTQQDILMQSAIVKYFTDNEYLTEE